MVPALGVGAGGAGGISGGRATVERGSGGRPGGIGGANPGAGRGGVMGGATGGGAMGRVA